MREVIIRAVLWTIVWLGILFFIGMVYGIGDCGYPSEPCLVAKEKHQLVVLVASALIWLIGMAFILRRRRA